MDVTFAGEDTNLHHIWDTNMPEQLRGGYNLTDAKAWADDLTDDIDEGGKYANQTSSWLKGLDITDPKASAMVWARDANAYVCSVVMPDGADVLETGDLSTKYYDSAIGTIEMQIAKGGYRLAAWLDELASLNACGEAKRSVKPLLRRAMGEAGLARDLSGREFLPVKRDGGLSEAKLRRLATGWGCRH